MQMGKEYMYSNKMPEILVFAGPNGSGKSTITMLIPKVGLYINADDIKKVNNITDIEAAVMATNMREEMLSLNNDFTFETVLSTERNIQLLERAKKSGYFIKGIFILTVNPDINVVRVKSRFADGGHPVPEDKIRSRYKKSLEMIPRFIEVCDICHIYDNTIEPFRIFKKKREKYYIWSNKFWRKRDIQQLINSNNE